MIDSVRTGKGQSLGREDIRVLWKQSMQWVMFRSCRRCDID